MSRQKTLPDKWVRKAIKDVIDGIIVDGKTIRCYDTYVPTDENNNYYVLMTTQTALMVNNNKCEDQWNSSILLDIFTRYMNTGNPASRLLADNIADKVRELTYTLSLDSSSALSIVWQRQDFENDISSQTENENVFRKLLRIEMLIQ